jgi:hypothetical protein
LGKRRAFRRITDEASLLLAGNPRHGSLEKASLPICSSMSLYEFHTQRTPGLKIRDWFQLTDGGTGEVRTAWTTTKLPLSAFTTDLTFQLKNAAADGFTFTIQNYHKGIWAFWDSGGGPGSQDIQNSVVSVKFDIYNDAGEGTDSTGVYTAGAAPTAPSVDMSLIRVILKSGDLMHAHLVYSGTTLTMTLTDTTTGAVFTNQFTVNIPAAVGGTKAYVGFTASTGTGSTTQQITSWTYTTP